MINLFLKILICLSIGLVNWFFFLFYNKYFCRFQLCTEKLSLVKHQVKEESNQIEINNAQSTTGRDSNYALTSCNSLPYTYISIFLRFNNIVPMFCLPYYE